jgi:NADH-quinone oxidoreductase subunit H
VPMIATMLIPTLLAGSMGMNAIIQAQDIWYVVLAPMAALIFMIAAIAELGRSPFDLNEAESEIVAGFHIEYTGMKFGLFYAGELLHAFTFGGFWAILFFGGYRFFGLEQLGPLVAAAILMGKALFGYWVIMWVRYTVMRVRIDHMLAFNWKFLTPLAFGLLLVTALVNTLLRDAPPLVHAGGLLLTNLAVAGMVVEILRRFGNRERARVEASIQRVPAGQ